MSRSDDDADASGSTRTAEGGWRDRDRYCPGGHGSEYLAPKHRQTSNGLDISACLTCGRPHWTHEFLHPDTPPPPPPLNAPRGEEKEDLPAKKKATPKHRHKKKKLMDRSPEPGSEHKHEHKHKHRHETDKEEKRAGAPPEEPDDVMLSVEATPSPPPAKERKLVQLSLLPTDTGQQ